MWDSYEKYSQLDTFGKKEEFIKQGGMYWADEGMRRIENDYNLTYSEKERLKFLLRLYG